MGKLNLDEKQIEKVMELNEIAKERAWKPANLNALTRSDREAVLERWLQ